MESLIGTISMGVRAPIIREGDNLAEIVTNSILSASEKHNIPIDDKDVIAMTESIVARSEGNYVSVDDITTSIKKHFGNDSEIVVIWPILSRNRFAMCLKGFARAAKRIVLILKYPSDEVGNCLVNEEDLKNLKEIKCIDEQEYRKVFGENVAHKFTGVDYVDYYKKLIQSENCEAEILFSNDVNYFIENEKVKGKTNFICADIHSREETRKSIKAYDDSEKFNVITLADVCSSPVEGSLDGGYNPNYGLLGSNKANEERIKLFPRGGQKLVETVQENIFERTGKKVEVMVYGDGAFKDPVGKIWELADPVVSPAYTSGLAGRPNELKLKALADGKYANLKGEELREAITKEIEHKGNNLVGDMSSQGTTPRQLTDLIGSLCDLTSGSGDKGTPIVWVKGYFKNYADE
jgi:F420-0:gamma-glutamyl ligase